MQQDEYTRRDLLGIRVLLDEDLLFFTRFWFKVIHGTRFIVADHHEVIKDWLDKISDYTIEVLNINIPPRFSKTELALNFIARSIGQNPTSNWLYITASDELRAQTSVAIRDIVTHPYFKIMYGVELKKDQNGKNLWRTRQGGGLKTATIGGQITGFGAGQMVEHDNELEDYVRKFEGAIVLDDINKIDDAEQKNANNDKVNRIIFNTIFSRKNSKDTPIINIQQRAGTDDATAALMEHYGEDNPKAKFLVMPVISNEVEDANGNIIGGDLLWEWKHDLEDVNRLKTSEKTRDTFNTQYMQEPVNPEGLLMPLKDLKFANELPKEDLIASYSVSDPADGGGDNLASIDFGLYYDGSNLRAIINSVTYSKMGIEANSTRLIDNSKYNNTEVYFIENNGVGAALKIVLNREKKEQELSMKIHPYHQKLKKLEKIESYYEFAKRLFIFREDWRDKEHYNLLMKDLTTFERDKPKAHKMDAIDLICSAARIIKINHKKLIN